MTDNRGDHFVGFDKKVRDHLPGVGEKASARPASPTPVFMRRLIEAWRNDFKVAWAINRTGDDAGLEGDPFEWGSNRPKTPRRAIDSVEVGMRSRRWLARFFRPVSDALFDGADDQAALRLWIKTDRRDTGAKGRGHPSALREVVVIKARSLGPKNGKFFKARTR